MADPTPLVAMLEGQGLELNKGCSEAANLSESIAPWCQHSNQTLDMEGNGNSTQRVS